MLSNLSIFCCRELW